ncbi:MAG TPA: formate dehydrogenase accessory sulfurtransferase FdhD [Acidimicrobiales bacterium]|nr:formate dehydrogenase accessory sulfurtransferase FdhD [Acidimicrobiales bacterium]
MSRGRSRRVLTRRFAQGRLTRLPDELAVEEPLSVRLDDTLVTTTMRTPGNDFELAAGFCLTEGLLAGATIRQLRYCSDDPSERASFNVVTVDTGGLAPVPTPRLGLTSSSCGICGSESIDALCARLRPVTRGDIPISVLADIPSRLEGRQPLFDKTGAVHAAAVFDSRGNISIVREDIGRHNAVDKVVGQLLLDGQLPATGLGLFVSGRASFEIVQKAWAAGFAAIVAVSAPSSLAVDTARAAGITLVGFARERHFNLYTDAGHESVAP